MSKKTTIKEDGTSMKVGDKVYTFNENRRVYPGDKSISSSPIYREHFELKEIVGETSQSWIIGYHSWKPDFKGCSKISKKNGYGPFTKEQVEEEVYKHEHSYNISRSVEGADYNTLKKIAQLVGYQEF